MQESYACQLKADEYVGNISTFEMETDMAAKGHRTGLGICESEIFFFFFAPDWRQVIE